MSIYNYVLQRQWLKINERSNCNTIESNIGFSSKNICFTTNNLPFDDLISRERLSHRTRK